jgi:hypothetical protein
MLDLPPELRIATVTDFLADLDLRLAGGRYARVPVVMELRQQIREFTTTAVETQQAQRGEEDVT